MQEDQEEKLKDVLILPKRMEYKIDGLRSELKEQIDQVKAQSKSELKQIEVYVQTLHSDLQTAQEALKNQIRSKMPEETKT